MANEPNLQQHVPSSKEEMLPFVYHSTRRISNAVIKSTEVSFFNYSIGQNIDGITATSVDTNMKKASAVEQPNRFWLKKIDLIIVPSISIVNTDSKHILDIMNIITNASFSFVLANKEKLSLTPIIDLLSPAQILPASFSVFKKGFILKDEELIPPEVPFSATLKFNSDAPDLNLGTGEVCKLIMRLQGKIVRLAEM